MASDAFATDGRRFPHHAQAFRPGAERIEARAEGYGAPVTGSTLALTAAGLAPVPKTLAVSVQPQPSTMHASAAPPNTFCEMAFPG